MREAAEALSRQRFGARVAEELDRLRDDPKAWEAYLSESEATTLPDGVD